MRLVKFTWMSECFHLEQKIRSVKLGVCPMQLFSFLITWRSSSSKSAAVYKISWKSDDFCCAMLCISAAYTVTRCLSVCLCVSVTFVDCVKKNKHIFKIFSPSGSHTILVFLYQTAWQYSDENLPNEGVECRWGRQKSGFSANIWPHRIWCERCDDELLSTRLSADTRLSIDAWRWSTDGRPSSGVSQSRCKSVYRTESHAPVNTPKRREHILICAAVNLTREYN